MVGLVGIEKCYVVLGWNYDIGMKLGFVGEWEG